MPLFLGDHVGAMPLQAVFGLLLAEAVLTSLQAVENFHRIAAGDLAQDYRLLDVVRRAPQRRKDILRQDKRGQNRHGDS